MVCKTTYASATLARDSSFPGIGVERHPPVFQTEIQGAIPRCPSISQVNRLRRQRPRTVEVMAGHPVRCAWDSFFRDAKSRCQSELHRSGRGGSTPPSCRIRVANFDSEVPALNRRELGANPRRPTISASVVKLLSSSASNGESAGGSPAGCTNSCRVSPTTRGAPLRTERLGVELPHAAPICPRSPTPRRCS